ncbi:MAG: hypothetical protein ACLTXT_08500 [Ruminococcus callidus]
MANTQLGGAETIDSYRKKIMTILKKSGRTPVSDRDLATKCRTNRGGAANFRKAVQELCKEGAICERRRGYVSSANMGYYPATIVRLSRTFGFARPEEEGAQDVFIPGKFLQGAMTRDRVLIGNIPSRSGKPEGEVLAILEEADSKMTGVIIEDNGKLMFRADSMSKTPIQIQRKDSVIYHEGEKSAGSTPWQPPCGTPGKDRIQLWCLHPCQRLCGRYAGGAWQTSTSRKRSSPRQTSWRMHPFPGRIRQAP